MTNGLEPMDFSGVFDKTFKLTIAGIKPYMKLFFIFFGISMIFVAIFCGAAVWVVMTNEGLLSRLKDMPYVMRDMPGIKQLTTIIPIFFVSLLIIVVISCIFLFMSYDLFSKIFTGEYWDIKNSFRIAKTKIFQTIGVQFFSLLAAFAGLLFCFIGVIPAMVFISLALPAMVYENTGVSGAFKRSLELVKNDFWVILVQIFILQLILSFFNGFLQIFSFIFTSFAPNLAKGDFSSLNATIVFIALAIFLVILTAVALFSSAFSVSFYVSVYFNQRIKKENFGREKANEELIRDSRDDEEDDDESDE
ncbi:MAG TPA: glycerophosphoryl diester phosphodiesterase membrane domain-containing protein [Spirochaetota bacterium]|nr:glycerophosphoryl diester phosphodiesterase membrane domain-containing protein [Spirochaetota bacterium]